LSTKRYEEILGKNEVVKLMGKTVKPMKTELKWRRLDYMKL